MTEKREALPSSEPGVYASTLISNDRQMGVRGGARVPGEAETVEGTVVFRAKNRGDDS
jgi:hypothetical protein